MKPFKFDLIGNLKVELGIIMLWGLIKRLIVIADKAGARIATTIRIEDWIVGSFFFAFSDEFIPL